MEIPLPPVVLYASALLLVAIVVISAILGERSIRRQRGGTLRRGRDERNAAGRVLEKYFRW
jgi:hypothetical protein